MKTAPFEYHRPTAMDEGLELLAEHAETAKVIAGGQSLLPMMALRLSQPDHLIDVGALSDLRGIDVDDGRIRLGAGVRQAEAERNSLVRNRIGVLADALGLIGHPAIRNRGTVGGSLTHADPAAELPAVAVALDAEMALRNSGGERMVPADEFFVSYLTSAVGPSEFLTTIDFRIPGEDAVWAVEEISRRHGDFALAGLVAVHDEDVGLRSPSSVWAPLRSGPGKPSRSWPADGASPPSRMRSTRCDKSSPRTTTSTPPANTDVISLASCCNAV